MADTYWHKQTDYEPLYPDLSWSRPERRSAAGKLLIIGGNAHGFAAPAQAYNEAVQAGIGSARVLLPDAIRKIVGSLLENGEFASSNPSGSFAADALGEWLEHSAWADGVMVAGDLGRNSETAILFEKFIGKYTGQLTLTKDAVDYALGLPGLITGRPETLLVVSFAQLQKLAQSCGFIRPFTFGMDLLQLIEALHLFTREHGFYIVIKHLEQIAVAGKGQVSTTKLPGEQQIWRIPAAAHASVWWLQNPAKPFEAFTTAVYEVAKGSPS